jgi:hypothetical protein
MESMKTRQHIKMIHEGEYVAEVEVVLMEDESGWSPYLSLEDACKLDDVRHALQRGEIQSASSKGRVYKLVPVEA